MDKENRFDGWSVNDLVAHIERLERRKQHGLVWDLERGREKFEEQCRTRTPVLEAVANNRVGTGSPVHTLIEGDNLHALTVLAQTHAGQVDVIYIDPPYNRGMSEGYETRYNDRYVDPDDAFRHSKWLSFMYKRLEVAKSLLKETGVIFVSIDDNELAHLKLVMDEIFGEQNYKNTIILRRGSKNVQAQFETIDKLASGYEYVLFYTKSPRRFPKMTKTLEQPKPGGWNNHWRGTDRPTMRYEFFGITPKTGQWRWSRERSLRAAANYELMLTETGKRSSDLSAVEIDAWFLAKCAELGEEIDLLRLSATGKPEHYVPPTDSTLLNDVWFDIAPNSTSVLKSMFGRKVFDNPKPLELVKRICKFAPSDALVLDFFAGSGTTLHAVQELNVEDGGQRRVILVTNNENGICTEVCYPRVRKVIEGYENAKGGNVPGLGGSLKYYRTAFADKE